MANKFKTEQTTPVSSEQYLLEQVKALQDTVAQLSRVNKHALSKVTNDQAKGMEILISTFQEDETKPEKVVTSWMTLTNHVDYSNGRGIEDQTVQITLEDGAEVKLTYRQFSVTAFKKHVCKVTSITEKNGKKYYTVDFNGKEYTLSQEFIN